MLQVATFNPDELKAGYITVLNLKQSLASTYGVF